jgi:hypothetical protein
MLGLELVPIWIEHERCVIVGSVKGAKPRSTLVGPSMFQSRRMEAMHGLAIGRDESQMKPGPGRGDGSGLRDEEQPVNVSSRSTITHCALAGKNPGISQRTHAGVIKSRRFLQIADAKRKMTEQFIVLY